MMRVIAMHIKNAIENTQGKEYYICALKMHQFRFSTFSKSSYDLNAIVYLRYTKVYKKNSYKDKKYTDIVAFF